MTEYLPHEGIASPVRTQTSLTDECQDEYQPFKGPQPGAHNVSAISAWVLGQKFVGITIGIILRDDVREIHIGWGDTEDLQHVWMPQGLPNLDVF